MCIHIVMKIAYYPPHSCPSVHPSVCPYVRTLSMQLPLDRFMWHFTLGTSWKFLRNFQIWLKSGKNIRPSTWRPMYILFFHATLNHH